MSKKIAVTGAGGYIGRHTVSALLDMGAEVIAADIAIDGIDPRAVALKMDVFSENTDIYRKLDCPDACLHMAWRDGFIHDSPLHMGCLSAHYQFIRNMLDGGLKQLAVMGTMHEVGYYEGSIDENTQCNPISMYGIAKDALRRSTFHMVEGTDVVLQWLRAFYIYGDDRKNHSVFSKLLEADEDGKEFFPFNSGTNKYDFIHVKDLAKQLAASVMQTEVDGIINCCTGNPVSLAQKVENFIKEKKLKIKLQYGVFPDRPYDSPGEWGNPDKINKILESMEA